MTKRLLNRRPLFQRGSEKVQKYFAFCHIKYFGLCFRAIDVVCAFFRRARDGFDDPSLRGSSRVLSGAKNPGTTRAD